MSRGGIRTRRLTTTARAALRGFLLTRDGTTCGICGFRMFPNDALDIDHVMPLITGGSDSTDNLRVVHRSCNHVKARTERTIAGVEPTAGYEYVRTIPLSHELRASLAALAKRERRTFHAEMLYLLELALKQEERRIDRHK